MGRQYQGEDNSVPDMSVLKHYLLDVLMSRRDIQAMHTLAPLSRSFTPWTPMALRPSGMVVLLNEIVIHDRWQVVELGGGVSTLFFARLMRERGRGHLVTVEHDELWARQLSKFIDQEGLAERVTIVHAPLAPCSSGFSGASSWYREDVVEQALTDVQIQLLLVDGPPAHDRATRHARYPAVPVLFRNMSNSGFAIALDDIGRQGERQILSRWEQEFPLHFERRYLSGSLALARTDKGYAV
jgi:hypothetical protein